MHSSYRCEYHVIFKFRRTGVGSFANSAERRIKKVVQGDEGGEASSSEYSPHMSGSHFMETRKSKIEPKISDRQT